MFIEIVIFLVTFLVAYFLYVSYRNHKFLRSKGVKFIPGLPIYGNSQGSMTNSKHVAEEIIEIYNAFPNERYIGFLEGSVPILIIRDPELIKTITVKNFDHFTDHKDFFVADDDNNILMNSVFGMKGERWRDMRTTLSPAFTGSKMRLMLPSMVKVANYTVEYLKEHAGEEMDVDDFIRRFTNDVIASAGFGLEVNSYKDKDNEFFRFGQRMYNFTGWQLFVGFCFVVAPKLSQKLGLQFYPETTTIFFRNLVKSTMEYREKNKIERPDMIQLLMEASKEWTIDEIGAQVFLFFTAGFETTASTLVTAIHELALNETIQDKLYQEIKTFKETQELTYENMGHLKYLDCVLNETMRRWSAAFIMDRKCVKPFELPPPRDGGKPYQLKPDDVVYIPVSAIHLDAKYYPEPMKFIPERFSDENKHNIKPFTFMPFGMGPRNCVGSRFALMELKILLFRIVLNFKILKSESTSTHLHLRPEGFAIKLENGSFVKFEPRIKT